MVVDAAHNVDSMVALVAAVSPLVARHRPRVLVFAASEDKEIERMLVLVRGSFDHVVLTRSATSPRGASLERLLAAAKGAGLRRMETSATPREALRRAKSLAGGKGLVVVAGSFFLAGEV